MTSKGLISILKSFSNKEFKEFGKFVSSPYFSKGRNVLKLLKFLKSNHPEYLDEKMNLKYIHRKLYHGKKFSASALNMQLSVLYKLALEFLHIRYYLSDIISGKLNLLSELDFRNNELVYDKEFKLVQKELQKEKFGSEKITKLYDFSKTKIRAATKRGEYTKYPGLVKEKGDLLTVNFLIELFKNIQDVITIKNAYISQKYDVLTETLFNNINIEMFINNLNKSKPPGYELVVFYYNRLMFYFSEGDNAFYQLAKKSGLELINKCNHKEANDIILNLQNCCFWKIKTGSLNYRKELFEIHKFWISSKLIISPYDNHIPVLVFASIFSFALSINEKNWAEEFLNDHKNLLNPEKREDLISYSYALLYFEKNEFAKSLDLLNKTTYSDYVYKLNAQMLIMRIYYETDSTEQLFAIADSQMHFLNKHNKKNENTVTRGRNFVRTIVKIAKLKNTFNENKYSEISTYLNNEKLIQAKEWLLEKLNNLRKIN